MGAQQETETQAQLAASPPQALSNFSAACPGTAGITEAGLLRCLREEVMLFFRPSSRGSSNPSILTEQQSV